MKALHSCRVLLWASWGLVAAPEEPLTCGWQQYRASKGQTCGACCHCSWESGWVKPEE